MRISWLNEAVSGLVDLLFPLQCAGCGAPGTQWCSGCARELGGLRRVHRPLSAGGPPMYALGRYRGAARRAVLAYKEAGQRHLAEPFGHHLATAVVALAGEIGMERACCLVPAPSRRIAARRRGGAHMTRVAHRAAGRLAGAGWSARVADCLVTESGAVDSAELAPAERMGNLSGRVRARPADLPPTDPPVLLIDDVITSGATAAVCARVLADVGIGVAAVLSLTATAG